MRRRKRTDDGDYDGKGTRSGHILKTFDNNGDDDRIQLLDKFVMCLQWLFSLIVGKLSLYHIQQEKEGIYVIVLMLNVLGLLLGLLLLVVARHFPYLQPRYLFENIGRSKHVIDADSIQELQGQFPVHVGKLGDSNSLSDWESIRHPGFALADQEAVNALLADRGDFSIPRTLQVPTFWNPPDYGTNGVRHFLGQNGKYLVSPIETQLVGSHYNGMETIFVALASYRDPECLPTVQDLYDRAKYPERIRVGIIDQRVESRGRDQDSDGDENPADPSCTKSIVPCTEDPNQSICLFSHLIDSIEIPAQYMVGPTFARHLAYRLYRGEYYALQVDSHVRFVQDWDVDIIEQWKSTQNEMAVLSTYLSDVTKSIDHRTHESLRSSRSIMCRIEYDWKGGSMAHIKNGVQPCNLPKIKATPMLQPFWAAGFAFARGHFVVQVPYDQYLPMVFQGEEISMAVRGFTFGYDYYAPARHVAFHIYAIRDNADKRKKVKTFTENEVLFPGAKPKAYVRLNRIIGMNGGSHRREGGEDVDRSKYFDELANEYGLGNVRSPQKFYQTFGIHTDTQEIEDDLCDFVQGTHGERSMHEQFTPFMRYDGMGIDYRSVDFHYKKVERGDIQVSDEELKKLRDLFKKKQADADNSSDTTKSSARPSSNNMVIQSP